jgi:hypothetical protein
MEDRVIRVDLTALGDRPESDAPWIRNVLDQR